MKSEEFVHKFIFIRHSHYIEGHWKAAFHIPLNTFFTTLASPDIHAKWMQLFS